MEIWGYIAVGLIIWFIVGKIMVKNKISQYEKILETMNQQLELPEYKDSDAYSNRLARINDLGLTRAILEHMQALDNEICTHLKIKTWQVNTSLIEAKNKHMMIFATVHGNNAEELKRLLDLGGEIQTMVDSKVPKEKTENTSFKKTYDYINHHEPYFKPLKSLNSFAFAQLFMPKQLDNNLMKDKRKIEIMVSYFGGVAGYVSDNMNIDYKEALHFITYYLVLNLFDGDYKKFEETANLFVSNSTNPKFIEIEVKGVQAYQDMFEENADSVEIGMRLKKLLEI